MENQEPDITDYAYVTCPQCKTKFRLKWDADYNESKTLNIEWCLSGGIYTVDVRCPNCNYEESI